MAATRQNRMVNAAICDEQDGWTEWMVAYGWLVPTIEDTHNMLCYREMYAALDCTVGYVFH